MAISYVFPNTADISQRGGLEERQALAEAAGCSYVEMPADFIKNGSEVAATGQDLCTFLTKASIAALYKPLKSPAGTIPYILHTEPSLGRIDYFGITGQAQLKWYDAAWVDDLIRMLITISDFLGSPPEKIEIHPGDRRNSFADIVQAMQTIQEGYGDAFGIIPEILLENRTGQVISTGDGIAQFWGCLTKNDPDLAGSAGIVLDIQQLMTAAKNKFPESFSKIPDECLKGFHIHTLHRPPKVTDSIPWGAVFQRIAQLRQDVVINPEIHHNNTVPEVVRFCKEMMSQ